MGEGNMDLLNAARIGIYLAFIVILFLSVYIAMNNFASSSLILATATLGGGMAIYFIQSFYEFTDPEPVKKDIYTAYSFDKEAKQITPINKLPTYFIRNVVEANYSNVVNKMDSAKFHNFDVRSKITVDLTLLSLLNLFQYKLLFWQQESIVLKAAVPLGTLSVPISIKSKVYEVEEIDNLLKSSHNFFSDTGVVFQNKLTLPPDTSFILKDDTLALTNPFSKIEFQVFANNGMDSVNPNDPKADLNSPIVMLTNSKEARFENRSVRISISISYNGLRNSHKDMKLYKEWHQRILTQMEMWFARDELPAS